MTEHTIRIYEIATDGLPDMDVLTGRVAFIFDGCLVSGWPILDGSGDWEADTDVGRGGRFQGVTHWVSFPGLLCEFRQWPPPYSRRRFWHWD